jgi:hypothetical protein
MSVLEFLFALLPASFAVAVPSESFSISLGTVGSIKLSTPAFSVTIAKA